MAVQRIDIQNIDKTDWQTYRFDQIAQNITERVDPKTTDLDLYIGLEHLDPESIHIKRHGTKNDVKGQKLKFYPGDVIFGKRRAYQRKAAIVIQEGFCSAHAMVLQANPDVIEAKLFPFFLHSDVFMHRAIDISVGSLSPTINWGTLKSQEFLLPPKDQQAQLAELLWAMDDFLSSIISVEDSLWILKRKISQEHYYDKTVPRENLMNLCDKIQDGSHFSPQEIFNEPSESRFRYVTSKNIRKTGLEFKEDQYVDEEFHRTIYSRCDAQKGDVLLTKDGANTGVATINSLEKEFSLLSSVCLLRPNANKMTNDYLCQYLNSDIGFTNMTGKMTGTAIKRLTLKIIKAAKIPAPSMETQGEITRKLNSIDSVICQNRNTQVKSKQLLQSLINQVF